MSGKTLARWGAFFAWAALACLLVLFNLPTQTPPPAYDSDAPVGHEVGQQAPDFTLTALNGEPFSLSACRGRVTVINLWATWCAPCVRELPFFDRLAREHPEDVAVLAIHSDLVTDDVAAYLSCYDYQIFFAVDEGGQIIASLGGSVMLPQTIVLNARGEVTCNQVGSVTYEMLEELVRAAQASLELGKVIKSLLIYPFSNFADSDIMCTGIGLQMPYVLRPLGRAKSEGGHWI